MAERKPNLPKAKRGQALFPRRILRGCVLGAACLLLCAVLGAFASLQVEAGVTFSFPIALASVFLGGYVGALCAAWGTDTPFRHGMCVGGVLLSVLLIGSLFVPNAGTPTLLHRFSVPAVLLLAAALGCLTVKVRRPNPARRLKKLRAGRH